MASTWESQNNNIVTYFPTPNSSVTEVQSFSRYSFEKRWIFLDRVFCNPRDRITFSISSAATSVASFAFAQSLKKSEITRLTYNKFTEVLLAA